MRSLFVSEIRYISNIMKLRGRHWSRFDEIVVEDEYYQPPRRHKDNAFNNDYSLRLAPIDKSNLLESWSVSTLPGTSGANLFATWDKNSLRPLRTELMNGEAFSINYFKTQIEQLETSMIAMGQPIRLVECSYARVLVVGGDVCFLAFLNDPLPIVRGSRRCLQSDETCSVHALMDADRLIAIDGWMHADMCTLE